MSIAAAMNATPGRCRASIISFDDMPQRLRGYYEGVRFPWYLAVRLAQARECDVIDASSGDAWVYGSLFNPRKARLLVTHSHGLDHVAHERLMDEVRRRKQTVSWKYFLYHGGLKLWEEARSFQVSDICLFLNSYDRDYAVRRLGVAASRCYVVNNGVTEELLNKAPVIREHDDSSELRIAQIGSYIPRKGVEYSAAALNRFLLTFPKASVSFLGTGCEPDRVIADFHPSVQSRVFILPHFVRAELPKLLEEHQILLFPSLSEGFGMALLEGMACGLAPVASQIPGPAEIIEDDVNGLFVPAANSSAIETALVRLACDATLLTRLRIGARKRALRYTWHNAAIQRLQLYGDAIKIKRQKM
jgi:glycosyltransferase involved in cell wall biosynthesis